MGNSIVGIWASRHITLEIFEKEARFDFDCANGKISKKIALDKNHSFKILGEYFEEHAGPVLINEETNMINVFYIGKITGKKMSLIVKRKDNDKLIGRFTLYYGKEPDLVKCR